MFFLKTKEQAQEDTLVCMSCGKESRAKQSQGAATVAWNRRDLLYKLKDKNNG